MSRPGHCEDINGDYWHLPGECPGAVENCDGKCCKREAGEALRREVERLCDEADAVGLRLSTRDLRAALSATPARERL